MAILGKVAKIGVAAVAVASISSPAHAGVATPDYTDTYEKVGSQYYPIGSYPCSAYDWFYPLWPINMVDNSGCDRRVWIHSNIDKTGTEYCIGPGSIRVGIPTITAPGVFAVGAKKPCP